MSSAAGTPAPASGCAVVWSDGLLAYNLGDHPLDPVRVELTMALARALGVLDRPGVRIVAPQPADDLRLGTVHTPEYLRAVRAGEPGHGLGTPDNPIFAHMHEASALVVGATVAAVDEVWSGRVRRAVNISGGLHHAMPDRASGFCVYNDVAIGIARLLECGASRVAYVDVDVHHGDGVERVFYDDPRVLTISLHETPQALFPGTGYPTQTGGRHAEGTAVNVALPVGTDDDGWLRAFHAVVPSVLRAFKPQVLVTQCGADAHRADPLADLRLTVDAQRASYLALRECAERYCDGRWIATGGGGYAVVEAVPRAWAHLLAVVTGDAIDPATRLPLAWREIVARLRPAAKVPQRMSDTTSVSDGVGVAYRSWHPGDESDPVDRAIEATRRAVFPLHGLDPEDPRD